MSFWWNQREIMWTVSPVSKACTDKTNHANHAW